MIQEDEMKLTRIERYTLSNQLRIMESMFPNEANDLSVQREIFEKGYEFLYDQGMQHIYPDDETMKAADCKEVWDTMDMFDGIDRSLPVLTKEEIDAALFTKFSGYDGNNEGGFMFFAEFTVERLRRFTYLKLDKPGYWNSHFPIRQVYQRMLAVWEKFPVKERFNMSRDQLLSVLDAAAHPESR